MGQREDRAALALNILKIGCLAAALLIVAPAAVLSYPVRLAQADSDNAAFKGRVERDVAMADQLMLKGRYADASDLYRQAAKRNPKNVPVLLGLGMALAKQFKLDGAEEQFDKVLALDPHNSMARSGKATVLINRLQSSSATILRNKDGILKQAEEECKRALEADPSLADAHLTLGLVYKDQGRMDEAVSELQAALKLDPKFSEALVAMGMIKITKNDLDSASEDFKEAIALNTANSTAHYGLGRIYLKQGHVDEAIRELNTSLYQFPNSAPVREALGAAYELQGNTVAAVREYQESIRIKPENPLAYVRLAQIRQKRGDIEHSIAELRSGLEVMPDNPELNLWVAEQSMRVGKYDDAIKAYGTVLSLDPPSVQAAKGLARAYTIKARQAATSAFVSSNEFEKAERLIAEALQLAPDDYELRLAQAKINLLAGKAVDLKAIGVPKTDGERVAYGEALLAQNRFSEAADQMKTVIDSSADPFAVLAVADLALMIKDLDSAEAGYKKALGSQGCEDRARRGLSNVAASRESARQLLTMANDLAARKQYRSSVDKYRSAIFADPKYGAARLGLARALEKVGKSSEQNLQDSAREYRAYLSLETGLSSKQKDKIHKRIKDLDDHASKLAHKDQKRAQK